MLLYRLGPVKGCRRWWRPSVNGLSPLRRWPTPDRGGSGRTRHQRPQRLPSWSARTGAAPLGGTELALQPWTNVNNKSAKAPVLTNLGSIPTSSTCSGSTRRRCLSSSPPRLWLTGGSTAGSRPRCTAPTRPLSSLRARSRARAPTRSWPVAADYSNVGAVPILPGLPRRRFHLVAFRTGVAPGTQLNPDGTIAPDPTVVKAADGTTPPGVGLTEAERTTHLDQAAKLYGDVLSSTKDVAGMPIQAINSLFGLAAVAECKGDLAAAGGYYKQIEDRAGARGVRRPWHHREEPVGIAGVDQGTGEAVRPFPVAQAACASGCSADIGHSRRDRTARRDHRDAGVRSPAERGSGGSAGAPTRGAQGPGNARDSTGPVKRASRTRSS